MNEFAAAVAVRSESILNTSAEYCTQTNVLYCMLFFNISYKTVCVSVCTYSTKQYSTIQNSIFRIRFARAQCMSCVICISAETHRYGTAASASVIASVQCSAAQCRVALRCELLSASS